MKPIEVFTKPLEKTPLNLPMPDPIKARKMEWVVVTKENAEEIFKQMEEKGESPAVFALTSDGYQVLAYTIADLRNIINTQREIIIKYKEYYEPKKDEATAEEKK